MDLSKTVILSCEKGNLSPPYLMIGCLHGQATVIEPDLESLKQELNRVEEWLNKITVSNVYSTQQQQRQQQLLGYIGAISN